MPWERLMREWVIYAAIMAVVFLVVFRDGSAIGALAGVLISGPLYLALGYVLAKFGYQRKTMKQLRAEREQRAAGGGSAATSSTSSSITARDRPAPTKRTSQGTNRPTKRRRR